jgi:hypothetical protein
VLPFELSIVYQGPAISEDNDKSLVLLAPVLPAMTAPPALWTILRANSQRTELPELASELSQATAVAYTQPSADIQRLEAYVAALDAVQAARAATIPKQVIAESFARWQASVLAIVQRLEEEEASGALTSDLAERRRAALETMSAIRQRLYQAEILNEETEMPRVATAPDLGAGDATYLVTGHKLHLSRSNAAASAPILSEQWLLAGCFVASVLLLARFARSPQAREWVSMHRHVALAIAGVSWWLLMPLGWVGWLALAAAAWLAFRQFWLGPARSAFGHELMDSP